MRLANKLVEEKSPYLKIHAYNPVMWYPWGPEAFEKAKAENKPILLSIGYSSCHFCHRMARESFEDEEIAKIVNGYFIPVKVDREERPDIDSVYMQACILFLGEGGWPLNVFLTPDKKPFFAITYLPKEDTPHYIGFKTILLNIINAWREKQAEILESADKICRLLKQKDEPKYFEITANTVSSCAKALVEMFDEKNGGFGRAPKFPIPHVMMFLLKYHENFDDKAALHALEKTLISIYKGGIHDHIGGGYFRYSTDEWWLVPHFEKMLYDNALLAITFAYAYEYTKNEIYKEAAFEVLNFLTQDLMSPGGAFYSSISAENKDGEGEFYLFTPEDIKKALGKGAEEFCKYYNIGKKAYKNKSIPHISGDVDIEKFKNERLILYDYRKNTRDNPMADTKILCGQNALAIAAFSLGAKIFQNEGFKNTAIRAAKFVLDKLKSSSGRLLARYIEGEAKYLAYSQDYAYLIWALILLFEATGDLKYLDYAKELTDCAIQLFWSKDGGLYFYGTDAEKLILWPKDAYDDAVPSANSVFALCLNKLYKITNNYRYKEKEAQIYKAFADECNKTPTSHTFMLYSFLN